MLKDVVGNCSGLLQRGTEYTCQNYQDYRFRAVIATLNILNS